MFFDSPAIIWQARQKRGDCLKGNMRTCEQIRAACVIARVQKSEELGTKAVWTASDHRKMVATVLLELQPNTEESMVATLLAVDNHSAFAQKLESQFLGTGHFVRGEAKTKTLDQVMAELQAQAKG